jgi:hypothetical protein
MAPNRAFFPQRALDAWLAEAKIDFTGRELMIRAAHRRYRVVEAARIIQEVSGQEDIYDLVGRVKSVTFLTELGAEILESSMLLGDNAYEVVPGFMGVPLGTLDDYLAESRAHSLGALATTDEDLLIQYLVDFQGQLDKG